MLFIIILLFCFLSLANASTISTSTVTFSVTNDTERYLVLDDFLNQFNIQYPTIITNTSVVERGSVNFGLIELLNNTILEEKIKQVRCGNPNDCDIEIEYYARRVLSAGGDVSFTLTFDESVTGVLFDDPTFEDELIQALDISNTTNVTIKSYGGDVTVTTTLKAGTNPSSDPLGTDLIDTVRDIKDDMQSIILGLVSGSDVSIKIDLCPDSRDCSGRGTCDTQTGICECYGDFWGINCETVCECVNGGECRDAYCHCQWPNHGLRCELEKNDCCTDPGIPTYECCTGLDTPIGCGCCTDGAVPVDYAENGSCDGWCSSPQGEDTFACDILPG